MERILPPCPRCTGTHINRFGYQSGKQRFRCCECRKTWCENPKSLETDPLRKEQILAAYQERMSQRGLARVFHVSRNTVSVAILLANG